MAHLTDDEVADFLAGLLGPAQRSRLIQHLLKGCSLCRGKLVGAFPEVSGSAQLDPAGEAAPHTEAGTEEDYDPAIDRALAALPGRQSQWKSEKERLSEVLSVLQEAPAGRPVPLPLEQVQEFQGRPLVEALLQLSFEARYRDPESMKRLAAEAQAAADAIPAEAYEPGAIFDLRARAWAELANAHRVNDELDAAETALLEARRLRRQGTGDLLLLARVADVEASLRRGQRRISEACALLEEIHHLYLSLGQDHLAGRALISRGICLRTGDQPQVAVQSLQTGLSLLDAERDPQLAAIAQQALLDAMVDCGEFRRAAEILLESGLRQAFASDPLNLLRLRWVEGKILAGLGKPGRAEQILRTVRGEFRDRGLEYDAALAGLDLAAVWIQQGNAAELRLLAKDMLDTFRDLRIHREAVKALRFFRVACEQQVVTARMVSGVRSFLVRLQHEPELRFAPDLVG